MRCLLDTRQLLAWQALNLQLNEVEMTLLIKAFFLLRKWAPGRLEVTPASL